MTHPPQKQCMPGEHGQRATHSLHVTFIQLWWSPSVQTAHGGCFSTCAVRLHSAEHWSKSQQCRCPFVAVVNGQQGIISRVPPLPAVLPGISANAVAVGIALECISRLHPTHYVVRPTRPHLEAAADGGLGRHAVVGVLLDQHVLNQPHAGHHLEGRQAAARGKGRV
jgi:hypothetical protein